MTTVRAVGSIVEFEVAPDLGNADGHGSHAHIWLYRVVPHIGGVEALRHIEWLCKKT